MEKVIKPAATVVVLVMIVLPVPPTTIIGLALIAHPRTRRYIDERPINVVRVGFTKGRRKAGRFIVKSQLKKVK